MFWLTLDSPQLRMSALSAPTTCGCSPVHWAIVIVLLSVAIGPGDAMARPARNTQLLFSELLGGGNEDNNYYGDQLVRAGHHTWQCVNVRGKLSHVSTLPIRRSTSNSNSNSRNRSSSGCRLSPGSGLRWGICCSPWTTMTLGLPRRARSRWRPVPACWLDCTGSAITEAARSCATTSSTIWPICPARRWCQDIPSRITTPRRTFSVSSD